LEFLTFCNNQKLTNQKTKKRAASTIDSSPPFNKKRDGGGQQSTTTNKLKAPLSDAGRKVTVPRKKVQQLPVSRPIN
jgi:hypothetical protein